MTSLHKRRESDRDDETGAMMGFLEHLDELRRRLIRALLALAGGMTIAFFFVARIAEFALRPAIQALPEGAKLITTRPGEGIAFYFDLALLGGVVLAAPFITYQAWRFIAPGLYAREKRFALPLMLMGAVGAVAGAAFTHYLLFPSTIEFFGRFNSTLTIYTPRLEDTFGLYKSLLLSMVAVFQMPTLVFFLALMGLVTARLLWRNIHYAILIIFIAAAVLTSSPDWWNQIILAAPMLAMYFLSIVVAWLAAPRGRARSESRDHLRLVFAASVIDQLRRHQSKTVV